MIKLTVERPKNAEARVFRDNIVTIGRSKKCDLSFPRAKGVSRFHCRLVLDAGILFIEDLGSRNQSFVNGRPVERLELREGDHMKLGTVELRLDSVREDEPTEEMLQPCLHCGGLFARRKDTCPRCNTPVRRRGRSRAIGEHTFTGYRILRRIGSGGMGIVFEAEELGRKENRSVALKVLRPHLARNAAYLARFIEETRVLTSLRHPSIVSVYGRGKEEDLHYLIMELVRGRSARVAMLESGRIPWDAGTRICWEVAKALNAAYSQAGIVHGDVKPGNFLLAEAGHVKLCDFGLAHVDLKSHRPSRDDAVEAERRGTAAFAAPERFREHGRPSVVADIYSLGVSLFQMVTGKLPFRAVSVQRFKRMHTHDPVPPLAEMVPDINPALDLLVTRMLAKDPMDRFADYPSLIQDLGLLLR